MLTVDAYTDEMLNKRLAKGKPYLEIKLLDKLKRGISKVVKDTNFGKIVFLDYKKKLFKNVSQDSVKLEIHIEGKFPFQAPKVILSTITGFPSLADGRNLLQGIIKKPWSEDIPVAEIANWFPQFFNENSGNYSVGRFHLGQCMSLKTWEGKERMKLFACQEIDPQNPKFFRDRALVVTHSMILQLEVNQQFQGMAHLVSYASLFSLLTVKVAKSDHQKVTFEWRIPEGVNALAQQFRINEVGEFISLLLGNSERLAITFDRKSLRPAPSISEEEVTFQALTRVKIKEITNEIVQHEVAIQDHISKNLINELIDLYQRAIEYYSALNDQKFETYLQKVRKLLADEVVLDVLAGKEPPRKQEIKTADIAAVKMFEDLEIWPSGPPGTVDSPGLQKEYEKEIEGDEDEEGNEEKLESERKVENQANNDKSEVKSAETEVKSAESEVKSAETEVKGTENEVKSTENEVKSAETKIENVETLPNNEEIKVAGIEEGLVENIDSKVSEVHPDEKEDKKPVPETLEKLPEEEKQSGNEVDKN